MPAAPTAIPRIIHQLWKNDDIPVQFRPLQQGWRTHHPGWQYRLWTDAAILDFVAREFPDFLPIFTGYAAPISRADAARYLILKKLGGLYVDLDFECLKPLDPLLDGKSFAIGLEPESHLKLDQAAAAKGLTRMVCPSLIASVPEHPFWDEVVTHLRRSHAHTDPLEATGPFLLTRALDSFEQAETVSLLAPELVYPVDKQDCWDGRLFDLEYWANSTRNAYALHHWDGSWFRPEALWQSGVPRKIHVTVTEGSDRTPAPRPAADAVVSCLMVTRNRCEQALVAVRCFQAQTYAHRELIIVDDSDDDQLVQAIAALDDARIRLSRTPGAEVTLGDARNHAVSLAAGPYVCQWDDDDLYDPLRLELQMAVLAASGTRACLLTRWTAWWPKQGRLAISRRRPWEGSLLCERAVLGRYPSLARGEDTPVVSDLLARVRTAHLDLPRLYLYNVHGANTFPEHHFDGLWTYATARFEGVDYQRVLREVAKRLPIAQSSATLERRAAPAAGAAKRESSVWTDMLARSRAELQRNPGNLQALISQGGALLGLGRQQEAEDAFKALQKSHPHDPHGLDGLARLASKRRQLVDAIALWDRILASFPGHWPGLLARARDLMDVGRYTEARRDFAEAARLAPAIPHGRIGLAELAAVQKDWDTALSLWQEVLAQSPELGTAFTGMVTALVETGRLAEAEALIASNRQRYGLAEQLLADTVLMQRQQRNDELRERLMAHLDVTRENVSLRNMLFHIHSTRGEAVKGAHLLADVPEGQPLPPWADLLATAYAPAGNDRARRARLVDLWKREGIGIVAPDILGLVIHGAVEGQGVGMAVQLLDSVEALPATDIRNIRLRLLAIFERLKLRELAGEPLGGAQAGAAEGHALRRVADAIDPRVPFGHAARMLRDMADRFDRLRQRYPRFNTESAWRRGAAEAVVDQVLASHRDGRPLSLIRLGDGEGNFLPYPAAQGRFVEPDRQATQCIWWSRPKLDGKGTAALSAALVEAIRSADIVGVPEPYRLCYGLPLPTPADPYRSWHDYRGLLAVLDHLDSNVTPADGPLFAPDQTFTSCHIHADLASWGLYRRLFDGIGRVSLIGCHEALPDRLRQLFGVVVDREYRIPHEKKYGPVFGYADREEHFPDVYQTMRARITVAYPGEVFLVAAGFLGKMYCQWIKEKGGIALDVGSVVDYWCGFTTRSLHFVHRYAELEAPSPEPAAPAVQRGKPDVLVLTPVRDAARFLPAYLESLTALDHPPDRLSLCLLEGDSRDSSLALLQERLPGLRSRFKRVELRKHDHGGRLAGPRWEPALQRQRRAALARARNRLLTGALRDEAWVLWIDADVISYASDTLARLLETGRDIVVPHCVTAWGGRSFDLNSFQLTDEGRLTESRHMLDGLVQPPRGVGRRYLDELRGQAQVPLDAVGGTMLLVRADLHRDGLNFPSFPYRGYIETEGLAMMARDMGVTCWGLPDLEILHPDG